MAGFDTRYFAYGSAGLALLGAMGSFVGGGGIVSLFAGLLCLLGAAGSVGFYKYGYILIPLITQRGNIVQIMEGGYEIPPSNDVVLKPRESLLRSESLRSSP